jgi:hypothetical protein
VKRRSAALVCGYDAPPRFKGGVSNLGSVKKVQVQRQLKALKITLACFTMMFATSVLAKDRCESWTHRGYPVSFQACSYENGGSGYYVVENNGTRPATVCWTINFNDGRSENGCHSGLGAGDASRGSCFRCGSKNGGARDFTLRKYEAQR